VRPSVGVPPDYRSLSREELVTLVARLVERDRIMRAQIRSLRRELDEARAQKGHAPFSKGKKTGEHKKPGRKKGKGRFTNKQPPDPSAVTDWVFFDKQRVCPHCGSSDIEVDEKSEYFSTTDLPPQPTVKVTAGHRPTGHCKHCGRRWRASHPDVPDDQYGATAHRLGPRVLAEGQRLIHSVGIPARRAPSVLESHGIKVTQSALTQAGLRCAEAGPLADYAEQLEKGMPQEPNIHTDSTGWRIGGEPAALTTFATPDTEVPGKTVYKITEHHGADEVIDVVGPNYRGTLNTDRGVEYRSKKLENVKFQKCNGHIKKNVKEVLENKTNAARDFGEKLQKLLDEARELHREWHAGHREGYMEKVARLERRLSDHLRDRKLTDPDNQRLLDGIGREHDAGNLLRFLHDPCLSPYNYLAERQLRPPIIARKISHGSKTKRGATARARIATVFQTERRAVLFEERKASKAFEQDARGGAGKSPKRDAQDRTGSSSESPSLQRRPTMLDRVTRFFVRPKPPPNVPH
jgi:transposase